MIIEIILATTCAIALVLAGLALYLVKSRKPPEIPAPVVRIDTSRVEASIKGINQRIDALKASADGIPRKTLRTFEGSTNVVKGEIAEWAAYQRLKAEYDRVILFNTIFDFLCIRFPNPKKPEDKGAVHFMEIKSGKSALSKDQKRLKDVFTKGDVGFKVLRIDADS